MTSHSFQPPAQNKIKGILWMLSWAFMFSFAMSISKLVSKDVPTVMLVFMRLSFGLIFFTPFLVRQRDQSLKTRRFPLHLLRVLFVCATLMCTYYAYGHLPLAFATSLGFTAPLMTTILALLILKERVTLTRWVAVTIGYIGILVMLRPGYIPLDPAVPVALAANLLASCVVIIVRQLSSTESTLQIMFYGNFVTFIIISIAAALFWKMPAWDDLRWLILLGACGITSQFCSVQALKAAQPSLLAPFEYFRLIFAIPIGYFVFHESVGVWTLAGGAIIIASTWYLAVSESREKKKETVQRQESRAF